MKKSLQSLLAVILLFIGITANSQNRYLDDVFTDVNISEIDTFAVNISIEPVLFGLAPALLPIECDIYQPVGDTLTNRPVIIVSHTGSFLPPVANGQPTGSVKDSSIVEQCTRWAKKGYVAVAMGNRKGWNPTSTDQDVRTSTLLQAAYRGIQDAKAMVRFLRMTEDALGNPFGIDPTKIVLGGQGTGAYISLGYATLDDADVELNLPKFIDFSNPSAPAPYVIPYFFGNIDGTDMTYAPLYDTLGNLMPIVDTAGNLLGYHIDSTMPLNIPNNPQYSNDINMAFNLGGALADISWLADGDIPIVSFHCENDQYAPIDTGDVIVPTTNDFVVEVMGSRAVQHYSNQYGNNDAFINAGFSFNSDPFTLAANVNNSGYEGLNIFITPAPSPTPNAFGESEEEQGAPWDWWDNATYDQMHQAVHGSPAGYGAANSLLGNPDMSATKARAYIDTIQGYLNPRIYVVLGLGGVLSVNNVVDHSTNIFPNPTKKNITIENSNFKINTVELYNIAGQLVKSENVNSMSTNLDVSDLKKGIYILEIKSNETSIRRKLIVE
tara:strand:+ start:26161 stop:27816 length:1656 start_codon:yes stop_codon:yes gene_type:complete